MNLALVSLKIVQVQEKVKKFKGTRLVFGNIYELLAGTENLCRCKGENSNWNEGNSVFSFTLDGKTAELKNNLREQITMNHNDFKN